MYHSFFRKVDRAGNFILLLDIYLHNETRTDVICITCMSIDQKLCFSDYEVMLFDDHDTTPYTSG